MLLLPLLLLLLLLLLLPPSAALICPKDSCGKPLGKQYCCGNVAAAAVVAFAAAAFAVMHFFPKCIPFF